jgi:hypothetical protein
LPLLLAAAVVVTMRCVFEEQGMIFVFVKMLSEQSSEAVNMLRDFFTCAALCKGFGKILFSSQLKKAAKGLFVEIFGKTETHLVR